MTVFTIGHSTRPLVEFLALLDAHGVKQIADIRSVPRSRRHPHFSIDALEASLSQAGVTYRHFRDLGGLRKPKPDSRNLGWRHEGFRGYADYLETAQFDRALAELMVFAATAPTATMCAEAVWWRCHRQIVADVLVARGVDVRHITSSAAAAPHALTDFARVAGDGRITYPGVAAPEV